MLVILLRNWLKGLNLILAALLALLAFTTIFLKLSRSTSFEIPETSPQQRQLPRRSFAQPPEAYSAIGAPFMQLAFNPATLQLPDLRAKLLYYGRNSRPDAADSQVVMHFNFPGGAGPHAVAPHKPTYLCYQPGKKPCGYSFSPENKPTPLWFVAEPAENGAVVTLRMQADRGVIDSPEAYAQFELKEKERNRFSGQPWQLGKWRVDGSLFARQRARWYGQDLFLAEFGGEEYEQLVGKQRLDFSPEGEDPYSVYVAAGEFLVWDNDKWRQVDSDTTTAGKPLLVVNKIEERIMNCELWDADGKQKTRLNLLRSMEAWVPQHLERHFRFVGAHTRSQYAFEVNKERMILAPDDWLVHTPKGWIKLDTAEQIDDYVSRKLPGTLFVFEGVGQSGDQQSIKGRMFNPSRTESKEVAVPIAHGNLAMGAVSTHVGVAHFDDDEDDDIAFDEPCRDYDDYLID